LSVEVADFVAPAGVVVGLRARDKRRCWGSSPAVPSPELNTIHAPKVERR